MDVVFFIFCALVGAGLVLALLGLNDRQRGVIAAQAEEIEGLRKAVAAARKDTGKAEAKAAKAASFAAIKSFASAIIASQGRVDVDAERQEFIVVVDGQRFVYSLHKGMVERKAGEALPVRPPRATSAQWVNTPAPAPAPQTGYAASTARPRDREALQRNLFGGWDVPPPPIEDEYGAGSSASVRTIR